MVDVQGACAGPRLTRTRQDHLFTYCIFAFLPVEGLKTACALLELGRKYEEEGNDNSNP